MIYQLKTLLKNMELVKGLYITGLDNGILVV